MFASMPTQSGSSGIFGGAGTGFAAGCARQTKANVAEASRVFRIRIIICTEALGLCIRCPKNVLAPRIGLESRVSINSRLSWCVSSVRNPSQRKRERLFAYDGLYAPQTADHFSGDC